MRSGRRGWWILSSILGGKRRAEEYPALGSAERAGGCSVGGAGAGEVRGFAELGGSAGSADSAGGGDGGVGDGAGAAGLGLLPPPLGGTSLARQRRLRCRTSGSRMRHRSLAG